MCHLAADTFQAFDAGLLINIAYQIDAAVAFFLNNISGAHHADRATIFDNGNMVNVTLHHF